LITASEYPPELISALDSPPASESDSTIERLLGQRAEEVISRVIAQRFRAGRIGQLRAEEREDLRANALLRVLQRLRGGNERPGRSIQDFDNYVAVVAFHVCDDLVRERLPRRTSAKNRLRYLLRHDRRFALWNAGEESVCGFEEWRGAQVFAAAVAADQVQHTLGDRDVPRTLSAILAAAGQPVEIEALVTCAAELWQMVDVPAVTIDDQDHAGASEPARDVENREFLVKLWEEIRQLNRPQRVALLLNLRDEGGPATDLFPLLGVATVEAIAETLELTPDQFAPLWRELPIEDRDIASLLGVSRQQVINLRKAARERLARRMRY